MLHLSYSRIMAGGPVSVQRALDAVAPGVRDAALESAKRLRALGIRHAIVGGIAVGAHGAPRNTTDVDFLVGLEAFEASGSILVHRSGVPVRVGTVPIDLLPAEEPIFEDALARADDASQPIPVISVEVLVQMKLRALRPHDQEDVRRLIQAGADLGAIREYLQRTEPPLLSRLDWVLRAG